MAKFFPGDSVQFDDKVGVVFGMDRFTTGSAKFRCVSCVTERVSGYYGEWELLIEYPDGQKPDCPKVVARDPT